MLDDLLDLRYQASEVAKLDLPSAKLKIQKNVCYIACGVMLRSSPNDDSNDLEVLLIQEAKPSCYGLWYLPAGRIDPTGESIEEAVLREVKEESGIDCRCTELIHVESITVSWHRFTFYVEYVGGSLKTTDQSDKESLKADWFSISDVLNGRIELRCSDICPLIVSAKERFVLRQASPQLPAVKLQLCLPLKYCAVAFILYDFESRKLLSAESSSDNSSAHRRLPFRCLSELPKDSPIAFAELAMSTCFEIDSKQLHRLEDHNVLKCVGVVSLAACFNPPTDHDGIAMVILMEIGSDLISFPLRDGYSWVDVDHQFEEDLRNCGTTAASFGTEIDKKKVSTFFRGVKNVFR